MNEPSFDALEATVQRAGIPALFDQLAEVLRAEKKYPQLFEALLMKKRHELGLPLQGGDTLRDLPEDKQVEVENYYVEVCRTVGGLFLESGDIVAAWPYFRAIDEPKLVAEAIERWQPSSVAATGGPESYDAGGSLTDAIVDIALNQGAHARRGYELVLSQYGVCRAITVFEHQMPFTGEVKEECGVLLVNRLYHDLLESVRADVMSRESASGEGVPGEGASGTAGVGDDLRKLIESRPWLFSSHGYHVDVSHLQSVVRISLGLRSREALEKALQMTEYGRRLARDFQSPDRPPFTDFYNDYRIFLQALLGTGIDGAVRYYAQQAERASPDEEGRHFPGEVLVYLLYRVGRYRDAIDAYLKHLKSTRAPLSIAPSLLELCERAGDYTKALETARDKGDLLQFAAGLVRKTGVQSAD
jgi:tetratricopeptide (TPR) repeat protein